VRADVPDLSGRHHPGGEHDAAGARGRERRAGGGDGARRDERALLRPWRASPGARPRRAGAAFALRVGAAGTSRREGGVHRRAESAPAAVVAIVAERRSTRTATRRCSWSSCLRGAFPGLGCGRLGGARGRAGRRASGGDRLLVRSPSGASIWCLPDPSCARECLPCRAG
jgi:hypothetical protein